VTRELIGPDPVIRSDGQDLSIGVIADGDLLARNGTAIVGVPPPGTPVFEFDSRNTPLTTSSATLQIYQTLVSSSLPAGTYTVSVGLVCSGSNSGSQLTAQLRINGIPAGGPLVETGIADGVFPFGAVLPLVWPGGVLTIETYVAHAGGAGSSTYLAGNLILERKL